MKRSMIMIMIMIMTMIIIIMMIIIIIIMMIRRTIMMLNFRPYCQLSKTDNQLYYPATPYWNNHYLQVDHTL